MMVINASNKRLWVGAALSILGLLLIITLLQRSHLPAQQQSQTTATQQQLESTIVNKLAEKRGQKDFFAEYRMERESMRGQQMEILGKIINDPSADRVARNAASTRLVQITEDMEKEMKVESLVKSKGFNDCVMITEPEATTLVIAASHISASEENDLLQLVGKPGKDGGGKRFVTLIAP